MKIPASPVRTRAIRFFAFGSLALTLAAAPLPAQSPIPKGKEAALSPVEQKYLQGVARDNLGEIAIGYLAIEKASSDDVKRHARDLIDTHTKTMKQLMEIASRHDLFLALEPDMAGYQTLQSKGGADFDKAYAAQAQQLNQQAINQLDPILGQFTAADVKDFAKDDLKDDKDHLKSAQELAAKLQ